MDLATPSPSDPDEEWELCNDDGFIYKRRKKRFLDNPTASASTTTVPPPLPPPDPAAEERFRRQRKKETLLTIKSRYQKELSLWEHLSSNCDAMREKARNLEKDRESEEDGRTALVESSNGEGRYMGPLIDKLLMQAELQEAIIQKVANLCDEAEALCSAQEDEFKESLINLPIWASPRELMAALSDE